MEFAWQLYTETSSVEQGNIFFSPLSITNVLSTLLLGAENATFEQLAKVLRAGDDVGQYHQSLGGLVQSLSQAKSVILESANKLYVDKRFEIDKGFVEKCVKYYATQTESANFGGEPEASRIIVNKWVEEKTKEKIKDLLQKGSIGPNTSMILANAIYFKGDWLSKFDQNESMEMPFHCSPDKTVQTVMMTRKGKYNVSYDEELNLQVVEVPYQDQDISMVLLVPGKNFGLKEVESKLTCARLKNFLNSFAEEEVKLTVPKFKMEFQFDELQSFLVKMGIKDLFDPSLSVLSKISKVKGLHVTKIAHKAFFEINEEGSEAAAATVAMVGFCMALPPIMVTCDHPFTFFILHKPTQNILFVGKYSSPE